MPVRIVSYNLLVPKYANQPDKYYQCNVEHLQTDYRWNLIQTQIEKEITNNENTIVCLQEVSLTLLPRLELFFHRLRYAFYFNLYGTKRNDYMGVGIAIPISMQLESISIIKIGDYIQSIGKSCGAKDGLIAWGWKLYELLIGRFIPFRYDAWQTAMNRDNMLIHLKVTIDNKSLCIGTYHMPCLFKEPGVMAIHSSIVKDLMFQLSGDQNFVLAGDFNIKPHDMCYKALTEELERGFDLPQSNTYEIAYQRNCKQVLKSAYREKNGSEPMYTNYSDTKYSPNFCATLDYIFFSGNMTVAEVLQLPDHPSGPSYPDETHPSDHLMIAATFLL